MGDSTKWEKRLERERKARREAEHLLEHKSLELYEANRRLAEEVARKGSELREKEQLFKATFYASMDGVILLDGRGRVLEVNEAVLRMLGVAKEQVVGRGMGWVVSEPDRAVAWQSYREVIKSGYCRCEIDLVRLDGSSFPAEIVGSRAIVGGKKIVNGVIRDMTQRRRSLAEVREAYDEAERANAAKSLFLASMSHEIRTPLNGVLGFTEMVLDSDLTEEQRRHLELVKSSGDILLCIVNDLLDFSKIESGQMLLEKKAFSLRKMMTEVVQIHGKNAIEKGLIVTLSIDDKIPSQLIGDLVRVRQVVTNLVSNAVKFTKEGFVKIKAEKEGERLKISVADSGIGLKPSSIENLFEAFSQADASTTRKFGGTGLGLAICRQLARAMEGDIEATGKLNEGAVFVFSLPLEVERAGDCGGVQEVGERKYRLGSKKRMFLVAEDHKINARLLTMMLQKLGHSAVVVATGREALEKLRREVKFDAVLMDRHMQDMDGIEATRRIREGEAGEGVSEIPIVAVTASALNEDKELCFAAGMNDFLAKPLRPAELENVLRRLF